MSNLPEEAQEERENRLKQTKANLDQTAAERGPNLQAEESGLTLQSLHARLAAVENHPALTSPPYNAGTLVNPLPASPDASNGTLPSSVTAGLEEAATDLPLNDAAKANAAAWTPAPPKA